MIARFNGNVVPFADDATSTNRTIFGGVTQSDAIDDNLNADFKKGWEIVGLNDNPTREDFNAMGYTLGALISYLYEMGISEWNASQNYRINSRVIGSDGKIYKALTGTIGSPNVNHNPTSDAVNWKDDLLGFLDTSTLATATTELISSDFVVVMDDTVPKKITLTNFTQELTASSETVSGIIELATTAETQAGTDDLRAITALKLFNSLKGSNQSLSANGYQKLHGGLIIQWGTVTGLSQASGSYTGATFPISFPNGCLFVSPQLGINTPANGGGGFGITNKTTTNFTYYYYDIDSFLNSYYYFAIGY